MTMPPPDAPKIYHIVHVDRLPSIIADGALCCDAEIAQREEANPTNSPVIGMNSIKQRRLNELTLTSHPGLHVGQCVPFYFCPRSIMLYLIHLANHTELVYRGGQEPIVHLEADLYRSVAWADREKCRWAFTLSNAGAYYFQDRADLSCLNELDWAAIDALDWQDCKEGKQAEFLMEQSFSWALVSRIGVKSQQTFRKSEAALQAADHKPNIEIIPEWYYN